MKINKENFQNFVFNVLLGMMIIIFMLLMKNTSMRQNFINGWFDYYIRFRVNENTPSKQASEKLIFLDFDDKAINDLGRPSLTPRNKTADLVEIAYNKKAEIIFLDFDFSENDYTPEILLKGDKNSMSGLERDKILFDLLQKIKNDKISNTKILIPFTNYADKVQKNNIFSSLIDNRKIFAVTPSFTVNSQNDNIVRFWLPYSETIKDNKICVLWSVPLICKAILSGNYNKLESITDEILNTENEYFMIDEFVFYREHSKDGGLLRDSRSLQYNRIQYSLIPQDLASENFLGNIPPKQIGHWRKKGVDNKRIDYKGKIVVIGRADQNSSDLFSTPVGIMPGMYVHGNSIATILSKTQPHLTPIYKHFTIEFLLVVFAAVIFLFASPLFAKISIFIMTVLCWIGSYLYFCLTDEFIYMMFAFTWVGVYNVLNTFEDFVKKFLRRNEE